MVFCSPLPDLRRKLSMYIVSIYLDISKYLDKKISSGRRLHFAATLFAAFCQEKFDQLFQYFELRNTIQRAALPDLPDQSHGYQPVDVMGQGGAGDTERCLDLSNRRSLGADPYQVTKNR
jgi:hypothetical protein